ncbi:EscS/YscS/HrcS family type III secretion system export apparatus protein [Anoxybacter fermentans]|uniref:Flagellar biosynthetic protein FliQ n=1 Tax=Anoxybacter fermentans TaxID=1323375 RepID=A0A3Q9HRF8_9FIRM|nr:flagellar biosynthesis protein FliQ [Anoxybacter fermentans]AZR73863.1 EscS/YscS/HrcS family type III secretion system export apparatus protein [Anoxybacter fermentans]
MTQEVVIYLGKEAMYTILLIAGPVLGVGLLVGLLVSIFQATTHIQEQTLVFIPKIAAVFATLIILGPWILNVLVDYVTRLFNSIPSLIG